MRYRMEIVSTRPVKTSITFNSKYDVNGYPRKVKLIVGETYIIDIEKPTTKKQRKNNQREVEILGFTSDWAPDVVIRYKDTGRRGLADVGVLVPIDLYRVDSSQ